MAANKRVAWLMESLLDALLGVALLVGGAVAAQAAPMAFVNRAAFDTAVAGLTNVSVSTLDFDGLTAGDLIADGGTFGGITFNYPGFAGFGVSLMVTDVADTTSAPNFLGTDDADVLQDGDDFDMGFAARNAIGLYVMSRDPLIDDDFRLTVGAVSASLSTMDLQSTLNDGTSVYFLGVVDSAATFTMASLTTSHDQAIGDFLWNADDVVTAVARQGGGHIPEPGSLALLSLGLVCLGTLRRRA